jgi:uncharacterized membrane protein
MGLIRIIAVYREERIKNLPILMIYQLISTFIISVLISFYFFKYRSDLMTFKILGDDPLTEWIAIQFMTIFDIPAIFICAFIGLSIVRILPFLQYVYLFLPPIIFIFIGYIQAFHGG